MTECSYTVRMRVDACYFCVGTELIFCACIWFKFILKMNLNKSKPHTPHHAHTQQKNIKSHSKQHTEREHTEHTTEEKKNHTLHHTPHAHHTQRKIKINCIIILCQRRNNDTHRKKLILCDRRNTTEKK